jgi:hypothetical protein
MIILYVSVRQRCDFLRFDLGIMACFMGMVADLQLAQTLAVQVEVLHIGALLCAGHWLMVVMQSLWGLRVFWRCGGLIGGQCHMVVLQALTGQRFAMWAHTRGSSGS